MLSYQHAYHAGSLADVHKHVALSVALDHLARKPKPLRYIETHAGRGLYDLAAPEAAKTGEAAQGIVRVEPALDPAHPYRRALAAVRGRHGPTAYPGSPLIAAELLRPGDGLDLAELHPQEAAALAAAMVGTGARLHREDGLAMALRLTPPEPRRGLLLVDPSYEVKDEYAAIARFLPQVARKWPVGVLMLWYPILADSRHVPMRDRLTGAMPGALVHELRFPPAREGHGMQGSGVMVVNPPWGLDDALADLAGRLPR